MITQEQRAINDLNHHIGVLLKDFYKEYPNLDLKEALVQFDNCRTHGISFDYVENKTFVELVFKETTP